MVTGKINEIHEIQYPPGETKSSPLKIGVSKNRGGPPKWMVYKGKILLELMIWGYPYFWKHPNQWLEDDFFLLGPGLFSGATGNHPIFDVAWNLSGL